MSDLVVCSRSPTTLCVPIHRGVREQGVWILWAQSSLKLLCYSQAAPLGCKQHGQRGKKKRREGKAGQSNVLTLFSPTATCLVGLVTSRNSQNLVCSHLCLLFGNTTTSGSHAPTWSLSPPPMPGPSSLTPSLGGRGWGVNMRKQVPQWVGGAQVKSSWKKEDYEVSTTQESESCLMRFRGNNPSFCSEMISQGPVTLK